MTTRDVIRTLIISWACFILVVFVLSKIFT